MFYIICQAKGRLYYYVLGNQMNSLRKIFAANLVKNRRKCGFSQAKLAEIVNVSTHHIAMIELTRNFPASELIERIANALHVEIYELFTEETHFQNMQFEQLRNEIRGDMQKLLADFLEKRNVDICQDKSS